MLYLIIANISLAIGYWLYVGVFRKLTFFQWNRIYLLSILIVSFLIPIGLYIDLSGFETIHQTMPTVDLSEAIEIPMITLTNRAQTTVINLMDVLVLLYWAGVVMLVLLLVYKLFSLWKHTKRSQIDAFQSFTFLGTVFLGKEVKGNEAIEAHERVHVEQRHSIDILIVEVLKCLNWFNPVLYLIHKELKFQHECIADELVSEDKHVYAQLLVANAMKIKDLSLVHEFSNQSFLKKRIMMLFKNKSKNKDRWYYLTVIPVLLIIIGSTLVFNTSKAKAAVEKFDAKVSDVTLDDIYAPLTNVAVTDPVENAGQQDTVVKSVAVPAEPPGGMRAFRKWIADNFKYPQSAIDAEVVGKLEALFVVEKDGSLTDIKIVKNLGHGTGETFLNLLKTSKKWKPGIDKGKAVRSEYTLPLRLDLSRMGDPKSSAQDTVKKKNQTKITQLKEGTFDEKAVPQPPGGMTAFRKWIGDNFKYPQAAVDAGAKGTIEASFVVEMDGTLSGINILKDLGYETGPALIELLKKSGKWDPAHKNGNPVRTQYRLPVRLDLSREGDDKLFTSVQVSPEPPEGMMAFRKWIGNNFKYPQAAIDAGLNGSIEAVYIVEKDGTFSDIKIVKDLGHGTGEALVELLKTAKKWKPGLQNGKTVRVAYKLPVRLDLSQM